MRRLFRRRLKLNEQNIAIHLINEQLAYVGKTWDEVKDDPNWFLNNKLTKTQHEKWKEYSIKQIQNVYKFTRQQAELEFSWFDMGYGLSIETNKCL
jgi:hypothetical protein